MWTFAAIIQPKESVVAEYLRCRDKDRRIIKCASHDVDHARPIWFAEDDGSGRAIHPITPPRSRPFLRPSRRWLRQPGDWRATPTTTTTLASAGSLLAFEYTSMERSERSTSARDTLLAYRHSLAVAV